MPDTEPRLAEIVGGHHVSDDPALLAAYERDHSFAHPVKPRFVARPRDAEQVRALIEWANRSATALVPVSSGGPHFNGDTVPSVPGAVMVDLRRLDRILRIDRRNRMAVIEPGVTYSALQPELAKHGMRVATPLLPRRNKSVVASLLERQPTLIPRYNHPLPEPLRNCGVIWGGGETSFTGEAGYGPHSLPAQWDAGQRQIDPKGPAQTDFFRLLTGAQGSLGIVVWASVRLELIPSSQKLFFVPADDLPDLIGLAYSLLRLRLGDEILLLNNTQMAYALAADAEEGTALRQELPPWVLVVGLGGRALLADERVAVQERDLRDVAQQSGVRPLSALPGAATSKIQGMLQGYVSVPPDGERYWKLLPKGDSRDVFFLTTLDRTPGFVDTMRALCARLRYPEADVGVYIQPQHQGTACHCEFTLPFTPDDEREVARTQTLFAEAGRDLAAQGAYFSRPYGLWAALAYGRDAQSTAVLRLVKGVLDPNNVLNPGKLCF